MHKVILYYDVGKHYGQCEEFETTDDKGKIYVNRCLYCHDEEIVQTSCLGHTQEGRRCFRTTAAGSYCSDHGLSIRDRDIERVRRYSSTEAQLSLFEKESLWLKQREIVSYLSTIKDVSMLQIKDYLENRSIRVYFIKCGDYVKIGRSSNPERRLKSLQVKGNSTIKPDDIDLATAEILGHVPGGSTVETALHRHLKEHNVKGEWFSFSPEVQSIIDIALGEKDSFTLESLIDKVIDNPSILRDSNRPEVTPEWISSNLSIIGSKVKDFDFYKCSYNHIFRADSDAFAYDIKQEGEYYICPEIHCHDDIQLELGFTSEYSKKNARGASFTKETP